jgi:hypothetical protein
MARAPAKPFCSSNQANKAFEIGGTIMKMNSAFLILCVALATTLTLAAQDNLTPGSNSQSSLSDQLVYRRIEGCLASNGVSYVLAVVSNGPKQYRVVGGDTSALQGKLGHTVQIDGMAGRNNPQQMIMNWDMREATTGVGWYTITAETVHDVTSNCSYPGYERPLTRVAPE